MNIRRATLIDIPAIMSIVEATVAFNAGRR
jgi:hypothetical protein